MKTVMHIAQAPGGVERYLCTLLKKMNAAEYRNILVLSQTYDLKKFEGLASEIECIEMYREINPLKELRAVLQIRAVIKKYKPDIVYMHSSKAGAIGRIANFGIRNVSIYNAHGWAFNMKCKPIKQKAYAMIERVLAPLCTKIVAISDYEKESAVQKHICKPDKIQVICNGIDFDEYKQGSPIARADLGIPKDAFVVGAVGRLTKQKAPDVFVQSAKLVKEALPNAFFVMVGDGDEQQQTEALIAELGLSGCFLITGWVQNPLDYIRNFDVAMLLSRWEGFGLVLPEYMLEGKPIVATRVDAIPNIITDGENGLLVESEDSCAAAQAVIRIGTDDALKHRLTQNGCEKVKRCFDAQRLARETERTMENLLEAI
jgi:glycosyltransferase involved in cell wall biosynthesis